MVDAWRVAESFEHTSRILGEFAARMRPPSSDLTTELDVAAVRIFQAFDEAGVAALLLKGAAIARLLYTAGEHRGYSDVDLLVAPGHLVHARHVLGRLGYCNAHEALGIDDVGGVVHEESWLSTGRYPKPELVIELHRWLAGSDASPEVVWRELASRRTELELDTGRVVVLDHVGLAMHLALHAAQHGPGYPKGLRELALALERWPAEIWRAAAALAADIEAADTFASGLCLVPEGARTAHLLGLAAVARTQWQIENRHLRPRGAFHLQALLEARDAAGRVGLLRRALLPRRRWIIVQYPWARRNVGALTTAYTLHIARTPVWAIRSWLFLRRTRQH